VSPNFSARSSRFLTEDAAHWRPPRGVRSRIASSWAPIARSDISGFAMAMPAAIIINRSSGGRRGVLSSSFASASRSRTALRTARRKRSMVQRALSA
jgi:hypothetical protein